MMGQPPELPPAEAAKIVSQKDETERAFIQFAGENRKPQYSNLTREEYLGYKEVKEGVKSKGWHITVTDKSAQLVLNTVDNYLESVKPHAAQDPVVTLEEITASEELLYDHCGALLKIFSVGKDTPEEQLKIL